MAIFAATHGCNADTIKTETKKEPNQFVFVEASNGLPLAGQWRQNVAFYDINTDGHMDILAPPARKSKEVGPVVWYGNGKGEWSRSQLDMPTGSVDGYGGIVVSDFDDDGIADIAFGIHGAGIRVFKGVGGAKYVDFSDGLPLGKKFLSRALVASDLDNDGVDDIAAISEGFSSEEHGAWVFYRTKDTWEAKPVGGEKLRSELWGEQVVAGDVNGDGNRDLAVSTSGRNDRNVWSGDGKGGFTPFNKGLPREKHYSSVDLVDLNKDGRSDLVASITGFGKNGRLSAIRTFLGQPDGFKDASDGLPTTKEVFFSVRGCDLDGDGSVEIVGGSATEGIKIFSRKGTHWEKARVSGLPEKGLWRLYNVYCVDLNKDGFKDVAVNYAYGRDNSGAIRVFFYVPDKTKPNGK